MGFKPSTLRSLDTTSIALHYCKKKRAFLFDSNVVFTCYIYEFDWLKNLSVAKGDALKVKKRDFAATNQMILGGLLSNLLRKSLQASGYK